MVLDDQLLIGLVLVAIGVVLALLTYGLVISRRSAPQEGEQPPEELVDDLPAESMDVTEMDPDLPTMAEVEAAREMTPEAEPQPAPPPPAELQPQPQVLQPTYQPIAAVLRDERTGDLVLEIGDRKYATLSELKGSSGWNQVKVAVTDLIDWLEATHASEASAAQAEAEADSELPRTQPKTMIEQINEILKEKLAASSVSNKAVRLGEGAGGTVRVYIGVQGYELDEVPDQEVRRIIREAVQAWEARS